MVPILTTGHAIRQQTAQVTPINRKCHLIIMSEIIQVNTDALLTVINIR